MMAYVGNFVENHIHKATKYAHKEKEIYCNILGMVMH